MTEEELDGYLVLIFFMLKKKKSMPSKKQKILVKGNIQKESSRRTLQRTFSYFNVLLFVLIWFIFYYTYMQSRRNTFHTRGGHGISKKYYWPQYYCFYFAFQWLVFSFLVLFSAFVVKARMSSHHFSKEFIPPRVRIVPHFP